MAIEHLPMRDQFDLALDAYRAVLMHKTEQELQVEAIVQTRAARMELEVLNQQIAALPIDLDLQALVVYDRSGHPER